MLEINSVVLIVRRMFEYSTDFILTGRKNDRNAGCSLKRKWVKGLYTPFKNTSNPSTGGRSFKFDVSRFR
jgi:hypothetical protein